MDKIFDMIRNTGYRRGPRRVFGGIGGSIAEKFGLNVWVVRLLILASFALPYIGVGVYLAIWALTPWQNGRIPLERALSA